MKIAERLAQVPTGLSDRAALYKRVFGSPEGQKVLADILNRVCNVDGACFTGDSLGLAYNIARRDVGVEIARIVLFDDTSAHNPEVKT